MLNKTEYFTWLTLKLIFFQITTIFFVTLAWWRVACRTLQLPYIYFWTLSINTYGMVVWMKTFQQSTQFCQWLYITLSTLRYFKAKKCCCSNIIFVKLLHISMSLFFSYLDPNVFVSVCSLYNPSEEHWKGRMTINLKNH